MQKGVAWSAIERFASQGVQFVVSMIVARLLMPSDYGVVAMAMILLAVLQVINESGFGEALMQKLDRDDMDISTVFVFNLAIGLILYTIVFFTAPLMADFFKEPSLVAVNRLLGLTLIINSFVIIQRTLLLIRVDLKSLAKASVAAALVSGVVAVVMAYRGFGVMSLVVQSLTYSVVNVVVIYITSEYRPSLKFSYQRFKPLFNYTYKLVGARLLNIVFAEGYPMVIGKFYSAAQLGFFNRATSFQTISSKNIAQIIQRVSTPILCEVQNDKEELRRVLMKFIGITLLVVAPIVVGMFLLAEPLVVTLLTDKWIYTAHILQITCPIGIFYVFNTFNRNLFNATGRTDWAFQSEVIKKIIFAGIIITTMFISFEVLIAGLIVIEALDFMISAYYTKRQIGLTLWQQIKSVKDILGASLVMAIVIIACTFFIESNPIKLVVGTVSGAISYLLMCYFFNIQRTRAIILNILTKINTK